MPDVHAVLTRGDLRQSPLQSIGRHRLTIANHGVLRPTTARSSATDPEARCRESPAPRSRHGIINTESSIQTGTRIMNHQSEVLAALDRSCARRADAENQLRSIRGKALRASLAELDSLLAFEVRLEARLTEVLHRNLAAADNC